MDIKNIIDILACPKCKSEVELVNKNIVCQANKKHSYAIINGIPRFIKSNKSNYEKHWQKFASKKPHKLKFKQAKKFIEWLKKYNCLDGIILDVGCGDGNHIPFIPSNVLCIAIDYTSIVDSVQERYKDKDNLIVIQANALELPFKDNSFDCVYAYSCINYLSDIKKGVSEIERILKKTKKYALWGYGTDNELLARLIMLARKTYKILPKSLQPVMLYIVTLSSIFIPNTTSINLFNSTWEECCEIISTDLTPECLTILGEKGWDTYISANFIKIDEFSENKGAIYQKIQ